MAIETDRLIEWFQDAESGNAQWREQAKDDINLYLLDHWDAETKRKLTEDGRPPLVIPKIYPIINFLSGYYRQNRFDLIYLPRKGSSADEANLITQLVKQVLDFSQSDYRIAEWFDMGLVTGRSWITGEVDYTHDPENGDLKLVVPDPLSVFPDPNSVEYDYSDAQYICRILKVDYQSLLEKFPDKVEGMSMEDVSIDDLETHHDSRQAYESKGFSSDVARFMASRLRVKEWYYTENVKRIKMFDQATGTIVETIDDPALIQDLQASKPGLTALESSKTTVKVLHRTLQCGGVVLEDFEKPLGEFNELPYAQFIVKRVRDQILSVVTPLKDIQKEVDKGRSQALHIINSIAKSGWWVPEGSTDMDVLKRDGGKNVFIGEYRAEKGIPTQIGFAGGAGAQVALQRSLEAERDLESVSGVNPELKGERRDGGKEPGITLQLRQKQGQVQIEPIFDNFSMSHQVLGQKLANIILKGSLYSPEEVMNIIDIPQPVSQEKVAEAQKLVAAIQSLFTNPEKKRFNTKVAVRPSSPTVRMAEFATLTQVAQAYPGIIEPEDLLEASDLSQKDKIIEGIRKKRESAAMMQNGAPGGPAIPIQEGQQ